MTAVAVIRLLGATLRYRTAAEDGGFTDKTARPIIWAFWHNCLLPATHRFQKLNIAVLTSRSFDGECISRIIERFGYRAVRGSSTRGGVGAMLGARREIEQGHAVAFTVDGPRGPRYVAKPGPVHLSRLTGVPIVAFHLAAKNFWTLRSWDMMMIPKPFSRVVLYCSKPLIVPADADPASAQRYLAELQTTLERVRDLATLEVQRN